MTRLEEYVQSFVNIAPDEVLNRLQAAGIVSDNCVKLSEVAKEDQQKAVGWIAKNIG